MTLSWRCIWKSYQTINGMPIPPQPSSPPWLSTHSHARRLSICKQALTMFLNSGSETQWWNSDYSCCGKTERNETPGQNTLNAQLRSRDVLSYSPCPHDPTTFCIVSSFTPLFVLFCFIFIFSSLFGGRMTTMRIKHTWSSLRIMGLGSN